MELYSLLLSQKHQACLQICWTLLLQEDSVVLQSCGQGLRYQPECQPPGGMASWYQHPHHHGPEKKTRWSDGSLRCKNQDISKPSRFVTKHSTCADSKLLPIVFLSFDFEHLTLSFFCATFLMEYIPITVTLLPGTTFSVKYLSRREREKSQPSVYKYQPELGIVQLCLPW